MKLRNLGKSGLRISVVGMGCNNFGWTIDLEGTRKVVHKALDLGVILFDTADIYGNRGGSEEMLGQALGERRKDVIVATKFGMAMDNAEKKGAARSYILSSVEGSLRRLRTDWIDLYQIHTPDPLTPIEETMRALDDLVTQGKVRYIGCSNFAAWQAVEAQWTSRDLGINSFISCQNEYSLLVRDVERELLPAIESYGLGMLPYFPLASGLLTGKYSRSSTLPQGARLTGTKRLADRYLTESNWGKVEQLMEYCHARGHSLLELAFCWLLARPTVASVIAGATKADQVEQNVRAAEWQLTPQQIGDVDTITSAA